MTINPESKRSSKQGRISAADARALIHIIVNENPIFSIITVNGIDDLALKYGNNETPMVAGAWLMFLLPDDATIEAGIRVIAVDTNKGDPVPEQPDSVVMAKDDKSDG